MRIKFNCFEFRKGFSLISVNSENSEFEIKNKTQEARIQEEKEVYNKKIDELQKNIKEMEKQNFELDVNIRSLNKEKQELKIANYEEYRNKETEYDNKIREIRKKYYTLTNTNRSSICPNRTQTFRMHGI